MTFWLSTTGAPALVVNFFSLLIRYSSFVRYPASAGATDHKTVPAISSPILNSNNT
jgi:hypothetical protein